MILQGNQRAGARNLAFHLLKDENELVEVHELRGFISEDLVSALEETRAVSRGTRARQYLFSLSLNPPPDASVATEAFESAIDRAEERLGLGGQPRAVVFHVKNERRHCHVVWSRIDEDTMTAVPLPFTKQKLMTLSRELYLEHGWQMPRGMMASEERDPANYTLAQWQQAKRVGKDPKATKQAFQECWAVSDSQSAFAQALKSRGYTLAKGDRRGFVAVDQYCDVYAVSKWTGVRTKELKAKLMAPDALPSVDQARMEIARTMSQRLQELRNQQSRAIETRLQTINARQQAAVQRQRAALAALKLRQSERWTAETAARQQRLKTGLRGFMDRLTGQRKRTEARNEREAYEAARRDQKERDALIFKQIEDRKAVQARIERLLRFRQERAQALQHDTQQYREIEQRKRDLFELRKERHAREHRHTQTPRHEL